MRDEFRGYYQPTDDEFDALWTDGLVVLDTNVLLNLYRYSMETRASLLSTLQAVRDRLWMPHRVGFEYQRRRLTVMSQQRDVYSKLTGIADGFVDNFRKTLGDHARHPILDGSSQLRLVEQHISEIKSHLASLEDTHPDLPSDSAPGRVDEIRDDLTDLFAGRVGEPFTPDELDLIYLDGADRYPKKTPPGYEDLKEKEGNEVYGDLVIWKEVLRKAADDGRPVIFVTDDRKDDWWLRHKGKTVGPRPELVAEFWAEASQPFHMYQPDQFMIRARERIEQPDFITDDAVTEVKNVGDSKELYRAKISEYRDHLTDRVLHLERSRVTSQRMLRRSEHALEEGSVNNVASPEVEQLQAELDEVDREISRSVRLYDRVSSAGAAEPSDDRVAEADLLRGRISALYSTRERLSSHLTESRAEALSQARTRAEARISNHQKLAARQADEYHRLRLEIEELDALLDEESGS